MPFGFYRERQAVVVGHLPHPGVLDLVGHRADRAVDGIDRDQADRDVLRSVLRRWHIALPGRNREFHDQFGSVVEMTEDEIGIDDLDIRRRRDHAGGHGVRALHAQFQMARPLGMGPEDDRLHVQDEIDDVLAHPGDRRELVQHSFDANGGDRGEPGSEESSTRRSAFPSVSPKPRSRGSMTSVALRDGSAPGRTSTAEGLIKCSEPNLKSLMRMVSPDW